MNIYVKKVLGYKSYWSNSFKEMFYFKVPAKWKNSVHLFMKICHQRSKWFGPSIMYIFIFQHMLNFFCFLCSSLICNQCAVSNFKWSLLLKDETRVILLQVSENEAGDLNLGPDFRLHDSFNYAGYVDIFGIVV